MMLWRSNEIDLAFIFNGRSGDVSHADIKKEWEAVIEKLEGKK